MQSLIEVLGCRVLIFFINKTCCVILNSLESFQFLLGEEPIENYNNPIKKALDLKLTGQHNLY